MKKFVILLPFVALFILPLLFYPGVDKSGWISNSDVHALIEFTASLLAITAGIMVLLHFLTKGRWFYLIISTGFVLIGAEEFVHAIFSFNRIWSEIPPTLKLAISSTWLTGRFILSASFLTALIIGKREIVSAKRGQYAAGLILAGSICAASVTYLIFKSPFLPGFVQLGSITKKLIELSLALLFFVAFVFYVNFYIKHESRSPLLWSIIACIICQILVQLFVFNAEALYDAHWDTAHLIVFLSYFFPIFGVWGETIQLHKTAQLQVIELGKEITERKRVEQTLQESEAKLKAIFEMLPIGISILDSERKISYVNPALESILDLSWERLLKEDYKLRTYLRPDGTPMPAEEFASVRALKEQRAVHNVETGVVKEDGNVIWVNASAVPVAFPDWKVVIVTSDISERKQAEQALVESEIKFKWLYEYAPSAYHLLTPDGTLTDVNRRWCELLGYRREEVLGRAIFDFVVEEEREAAKASFEKKKQSRQTYVEGSERNFITKDGALRTFKTYDFFVMDQRQNITSVQTTIEDITERKRAEEALRESENRLRTIVEGTQALLMSVDTNGHFIYANDATARAVGFTNPAELIGKAYLHFIHPEDRHQVLNTFSNQANTRQPSSLQEFRIVDTAGKVKWFSFLASLEIKAGQVVGRSGVALDITERKRAEEALRKKDEHYRNVIESIFRFVPEGLLVLSEDFSPLKQNKAFGELVQQYAARLGYTEQELAEQITEQVRCKILSEDTTEIQIPKKRL